MIRTRVRKKQRPRFKNVFRLVILVGLMQSFHHTEARSPRQIKNCQLKGQFYSEHLLHCVQCTTYKSCDDAYWKDIERCRNACRKDEPSTTKPPISQTHTIGSKATTRPLDVSTAENEIWDKYRILFICVITIGSGLVLLLTHGIVYVIYRKYTRTRPSTSRETPSGQLEEIPHPPGGTPRQLEETQHSPGETPHQMETAYRPLEERSRFSVDSSPVYQIKGVIYAESPPSIISEIFEELHLSSSLEETEEFEEV